MTTPKQKPHRSEQSVGTPWEFIEAVERRWGKLTIDLAADAINAKAPLFITEAQDSLGDGVFWAVEGNSWLNPPFANIGPWAKKCREQQQTLGPAFGIFLLVPASVGSHWYWDHLAPFADVYALSPRLTFEGHTSAYPKDLVLAHYTRHAGGAFKHWEWRS